jgi:hypothetical protein
VYGLHRTHRPYGHKNRRLDNAVVGMQLSGTRLALGVYVFEGEFHIP